MVIDALHDSLRSFSISLVLLVFTISIIMSKEREMMRAFSARARSQTQVYLKCQ